MTTVIPRLSACGVADMQYLDGVARDLIEQFVGILNERYDVNAWTLFNHLRTFWPPSDAPLDGAESLLKRLAYGRIVVSEKFKNFVEVAQSLVGEHDLHVRRCLANTASTSSSVANRPSRAARRPRSMPANSSAVARYMPPRRLASICSAISASSSWASSGHSSARRIASLSAF